MRYGRLLVGLGLIAIGALLLLDRADVVDAGEVISDWWPIAVVIFGLAQLASSPRSPTGPLIVVGVGLALLLVTLGPLDVSPFALIWPLVLIALGVGLLVGWRRGPRGEGEDVVSSTTVFAGSDLASSSRRFRGGSLSAVFGAVTLDLRGAALAPDGARIEATAAFGGVDILVPGDWRVSVRGTPLFGAFEDARGRDGPPPQDGPVLEVGGFALFGAVEVKRHRKG